MTQFKCGEFAFRRVNESKADRVTEVLGDRPVVTSSGPPGVDGDLLGVVAVPDVVAERLLKPRAMKLIEGEAVGHEPVEVVLKPIFNEIDVDFVVVLRKVLRTPGLEVIKHDVAPAIRSR